MNPRQLVKRNPFLGLRSFGPEDHKLFFGRDNITERLVKRLLSRRIVSLSGDMGVGKTSVVSAGVWPYLLNADTNNTWAQITFLPGDDPLSRFSKALASCFAPFNQDYEEEELGFYIYNSLFSSEEGISKIIEEFFLETGQNLLIFIDQFEDTLKVLKDSNPGSEIDTSVSRFLDALLVLKSRKDFPVYIILATQTPFFNYGRNFPGMSDLMEKTKFNVPGVNRNELKIILEGLLSKSRLPVSSALKETLYKDAVQHQFSLGSLVLTLSRLWQYWSHASENKKLNEEDYDRAGRLNQIFEITGEEAIENLESYYLQVVAEKIFKGLTEISASGLKHKRTVEFGKLCELVKVDPEEIKVVLKVFAKHDCSFLNQDFEHNLREDSQITLSSDAIIYSWPRVSKWAVEEAESARIYLALARDSELFWKGKAELWKGDKLIAGNKWYEDNSINSVWAERYHPEFFQAIEFLNLSKEKFEEIIATKANKKLIRKARSKKIRILAAASFAGIIFAASLFLAFSFLSANDYLASSEQLNISIQETGSDFVQTTKPAPEKDNSGVLVRESYDVEELKLWAKNEVLKQAESGSVAGLPLSRNEANSHTNNNRNLENLPLSLEENPASVSKIGEISLENLKPQEYISKPDKKNNEVAEKPKNTIPNKKSNQSFFRDYSGLLASLETGFSPQNELPNADMKEPVSEISQFKANYIRPDKPLVLLPDPELAWRGGEPVIFALEGNTEIKAPEHNSPNLGLKFTEALAAEGNLAFDNIPAKTVQPENKIQINTGIKKEIPSDQVSILESPSMHSSIESPDKVLNNTGEAMEPNSRIPQDISLAYANLNHAGMDLLDSEIYLNSFQTLLKYNGKDYSSTLSGPIRDMTVSSNGYQMAAGSDNGEVRLFSLNNGKLLRGQKVVLENTQVRSIAWSPDNKILAVGTGSGDLVLFEKANGKFEEVTRHSTGKAIHNVRFLKGKQNYFMVFNDVNALHLVTYRYSIVEITETIPHSFIRSMETGNDQKTVMVGESGSCKLYRFDEAGISLGSPATYGMQNQVSAVSMSANGALLAVGLKDGNLCLLKLNSARDELERKMVRIGHSQISGLDISGNGSVAQIAVSSYDQTLRLIQLSDAFSTSETPSLVLTGHNAPLSRAKYCMDGQYIITTSKSGEVKFWPNGMNILSRDIRDKYQIGDKSLSLSR